MLRNFSQSSSLLKLSVGLTVLFFLKRYEFLPYLILLFVFIGFFIPFLDRLFSTAIESSMNFLFNLISWLVLAIIYYLVLTPVGWLYRLSGNDPLKLKPKNQKELFISRNYKFKKEDFIKPW